ncbi:hypothetical protein LCGC14_1822310 [marine sediment metagenome]|uniref:Uncharacterized protein n=1 Tax=marine sediment metagenome TaxID=412755 RepID=A0A0F9GIL6_9ZZZZ
MEKKSIRLTLLVGVDEVGGNSNLLSNNDRK